MASEAGDWAWKAWVSRYDGLEPTWLPKDWTALARLQRLLGAHFKGTWAAYLQDSDKFYRGHPPSLLLANMDKFRVVAAPEQPEMFPVEQSNFAGLTDEQLAKTRQHAMEIRQTAYIEAEKRRKAHQEGVRQAILRSDQSNRKANLEAARSALRDLRGSLDKNGEIIQ